MKNSRDMTDQEKINRRDTLELLRQQIGGCFGRVDKLFARHPLDEERAKNLCVIALENKITLQEINEIILEYLHEQLSNSEHINSEFEEAKKMFKNIYRNLKQLNNK